MLIMADLDGAGVQTDSSDQKLFYQPDSRQQTFTGYNKSLGTVALKENSGIFKPRPYFWHEIRSSTHREQFGESRRPSEDI